MAWTLLCRRLLCVLAFIAGLAPVPLNAQDSQCNYYWDSGIYYFSG